MCKAVAAASDLMDSVLNEQRSRLALDEVLDDVIGNLP
jgi:hypothetical protein